MKRAATFYAVLLIVTGIISRPALGQITPSDDSYTLTNSPTKNFGTAKSLAVESTGGTAFIRFDLSSIPSSVTGSMVAKGTLKIFVDTVPTAGSFNIDLVTSPWTEESITANNTPTLGSAIASAIPITTSDKDQYILVDVTSAVVDWLNGTSNDGVALVPDGKVSFTLDSKEATTTSHPAELDIVLTGPQGPPGPPGPISGVTAGPGLTGGGTKGTVTLSMLTSCSKNQILQWNGSTWACSSAGTGTITGVTAGTDLTGGGTGGNITLNLDTVSTDKRYAQLAAANSFTGQGAFISSSNVTPLEAFQNDTADVVSAIGGVMYSAQPGSAAVEGLALAKSGNVFGIEGYAQSSAASGVYGLDGARSQTGGAGGSSGVWGDAGSLGLRGVTGTADNAYGVVGLNNSASKFAAIYAGNFGTSSIAPGLLANSWSPVGMGAIGAGLTYSNNFTTHAGFNAVGVVGDSSATTGIGVWGSTDTGTSVYGSTNSGTGVYGLSSTGSGVIGTSTTGAGVAGASSSGSNAGVYGVTQNTNANESGYAVWGDDPTTTGTNWGVYGYSQSGIGVVGVSGASRGGTAGSFYAVNAARPFEAEGPIGGCYIDGAGDLICNGSKSAAVHLSDSRWVRLYAVESPENWFEDFGTGTLSNGSASVALETTFRDTVTSSQDYHVFLTPRGECEGLYIAETNSSGFAVRELHHGKSNIAFDYRIVVRRKGYENIRMQDVTEVQEHMITHMQEIMKRLPHRQPVIQPVAQPMANRAQPEIQLPVPSRPSPSSNRNRLPTVLPVQPAAATTKR